MRRRLCLSSFDESPTHECVLRKLKRYLPGHECRTVPEAGFAAKKNGELLALAEQEGFDVFLTLDTGIEYEQNLAKHKIAVLLIRAKTSRLDDVADFTSEILNAFRSIQYGQLIKIG